MHIPRKSVDGLIRCPVSPIWTTIGILVALILATVAWASDSGGFGMTAEVPKNCYNSCVELCR